MLQGYFGNGPNCWNEPNPVENRAKLEEHHSISLSPISFIFPHAQMFAKVFLFLALIAVAAAFAPRSPVARKYCDLAKCGAFVGLSTDYSRCLALQVWRRSPACRCPRIGRARRPPALCLASARRCVHFPVASQPAPQTSQLTFAHHFPFRSRPPSSALSPPWHWSPALTPSTRAISSTR